MNRYKFMLCWFFATATSLLIAQGTYARIAFPASTSTVAYGINSKGDVSGYYTDTNNNFHGFLLRSGKYTSIDYPGSTSTIVYGLNDSDDVVGFSANSDVGFVYQSSTQSFTELTYPGASATIPAAINNAGLVCGSFGPVSYSAGFEFDGSTYTEILPPGAFLAFLNGVDSRGACVGNWASFLRKSGNFSFHDGRYSHIKIPAYKLVWGVNPAGTAFVGSWRVGANSQIGFLYQNQIFQKIRVPGSTGTIAYGINSAGAVVGAYGDLSGQWGFLWTPPAK